jgi:hypothetical protein
MTRFRTAGALTAGLLIVGVLTPAVASAATPVPGAAEHMRPAAIAQHTAATATNTASPVPIGTPLQLQVPEQELLLLPSLLGSRNASRFTHR